MKIPPTLEPQAVLLHPGTLTKHFRSIIGSNPSVDHLNSINSYILHQIYNEAIPVTAYRVWLPIACRHSSHFLNNALRDQTSSGVRRAGIKYLHQVFHRLNWKKSGWDPLGGAKGIKEIIDELPLDEVRLLVQAISRGGPCSDWDSLMACTEELMDLIQQSDTWTTRSLSHYVFRLYAQCTPNKVADILDSGHPESPDLCKDLALLHPKLLRQVATGVIHVSPGVRKRVLDHCKDALLISREPYFSLHATGSQSDLLPGLVFGIDILQVLISDRALRSNTYRASEWIDRILALAVRQGLPFETILPIFNACLELARLVNSSNWLSQPLPGQLLQLWNLAWFDSTNWKQDASNTFIKKTRNGSQCRPTAQSRSALDRSLVENVLQIRDERLSIQPVQPAQKFKSTHHPRLAFTNLVTSVLMKVKSEGRYELLKLLCKHSPSLKFDITAWPPIKEERNLEEKSLVSIWTYGILRSLPHDHSKLLFQRSLSLHRCEDFLPSGEEKGSPWTLSWQQQCMLWACWESMTAKTTDDMPVTNKALVEMKQRAERGRDATERERWATAAIQLSMEIKSLDVVCDIMKWNARFLRDPFVFPKTLEEILKGAGPILACGSDLRLANLSSRSDLEVNVKTAHKALLALLQTFLLLIREPWYKGSVKNLRRVSFMFSTIISSRMAALRSYTSDELAKEPDIVELLLGSLLPIIIQYELEGNTEGQTLCPWAGSSAIVQTSCPDSPTTIELKFMDLLAFEREKLWLQLRVSKDPNTSLLDKGWPRGLSIQELAVSEDWLYHALQRPIEAPFLSSRAHEVLFSSVETLMTSKPEQYDSGGGFVDSLAFIVRAMIAYGEEAAKVQCAMQIWEHYLSVLQSHPLYLEIFQDWLAPLVESYITPEAKYLIRPRSRKAPDPMILKVQRGPGVNNWNPLENFDQEIGVTVKDERPKEIPRVLLNYRMHPSQRSMSVRTREVESTQPLRPVAIWSSTTKDRHDLGHQEAVILSALLFIDSSTPHPKILRRRFPNNGAPRYPPTYLSDSFITRMSKADTGSMSYAVSALSRCARDVPAELLRDLICCFLDALKACPEASNYRILLDTALDLIIVLLRSDQPQLVIEAVLRVWTEFPKDSSSHRKINLVRIGRVLTPKQARGLVQGLVKHACDMLQGQVKPLLNEGKPFMKVTTVKMIAQTLAEADFLQPSTRLQLLEEVFRASQHIDIRVEIAVSVLKLIIQSHSTEPLGLLTSISLCASSPSERDIATEDHWRIAESGGQLPPIMTSSRPILHLLVWTAKNSIPENLRPDYVQKILLPLLQDSTRNHTRWITCLLSRMGTSLAELGLDGSVIGPFDMKLVDDILRVWAEYLPGSYLQIHRTWAFGYLHHTSFNRISEALKVSTAAIAKSHEVQTHIKQLVESLRDRQSLGSFNRLLSLPHGKVQDGLTDQLVLKELTLRAERIVKFPIKYVDSEAKFAIFPKYSLELLGSLRSKISVKPNDQTSFRQRIYEPYTKLMAIIAAASEKVRTEGWPTEFTAYPVTLPSKIEYELLLLPSPVYGVSTSSSALEEFMSALTDLISNYAQDLVLWMKFDSVAKILKELSPTDKVVCALVLGDCNDGNRKFSPVETWIRVKLAAMLLHDAEKTKTPLKKKALEMIKRWKHSDIEVVRQIGWGWQ